MRRVAAGVVAALLFGACGVARGETRSSVTVLAAASLAEAFGDFHPGGSVTYSFAGSQQLAAQVEAGAPADVVATADEASMDRLVKGGLVEAPRIFAHNRLAVAVRPGNPKGIAALADLARPDLRVTLADPSVPAGNYAVEALGWAGVRVRPVSLELDVKAVVARVASGEADAGVVYVTDATRAAGVEAVAIPDALNVLATYPVAVVRASHDVAAARAFVDHLLGGDGRRALAAHGFQAP